MFTSCQHYYPFGVEVKFTRMWGFTWRLSDCEELSGGYLECLCLCEELVGEVNHTTECVTDLFSFVDVE